MKDVPLTQYVQLDQRTLLVGAPYGRAWLAVIGVSNIEPLPASIVAAKRPSIAASLVEGAIYAGLTRAERVSATEPYTSFQYVRWLVGNYCFAGQTPGLFRHAAERFEVMGRPDLAQFACAKATEEDGHAELALRDLDALGLPGAKVVQRIRPPSADAFAACFRGHVESDEPVALFGFSYCMERMALERDAAFIDKVRAVCPAGVDAFRFLRVHSALGSDSGHVDEQLARFESFDAEALECVVHAAYQTARMLAQQPLLDAALTDAAIADQLSACTKLPTPIARPAPTHLVSSAHRSSASGKSQA